jgi:transcription antitermination factor NusG
MTAGSYWAVAQTVTTMEHVVLRDIEKTNHGTFVPTYARHWKVDGRQHSKEYPLFGGYVLFQTNGKDWAGIPDIHGVYGVLAGPDELGRLKPMMVTDAEMLRLFMASALNRYTKVDAPRYTKYFRGERPKRKTSRKPRPGNRLRNATAA